MVPEQRGTLLRDDPVAYHVQGEQLGLNDETTFVPSLESVPLPHQ
jgi:hypothetical protein